MRYKTHRIHNFFGSSAFLAQKNKKRLMFRKPLRFPKHNSLIISDLCFESRKGFRNIDFLC
jgi:hypothetical protein